MSHDLAQTLSAMLGNGAEVGYEPVAGADGLWPEELSAITRAVPKRRAEFAAGRRAARTALARLGQPATAIPVGERRAPVWPQGIAGAITHDMDIALAAAAHRKGTLGIGIDLTQAAPLPEPVRRKVLPHAEEAGLDGLEARAVFSAKESLFKAIFPLVGAYFGFSAARVVPSLATGLYEVELTRELGPFAVGTRLAGRVHVEDSCLLTSLSVPEV